MYVRDCIVDGENNRIIFLVNAGDVARAIGLRGSNVQRLRKLLNKDIEIVGYSEDLAEQVKYALAPAKVREVKVVNRPGGKRVAYVIVDPSDKGIAIGRNGKNVSKATLILRRYFGIDGVVIV